LLAGATAAAAGEAVVNGFRMHYEDRGQGPAVVLLHGFSLDPRMWHHQLRLAKKKLPNASPAPGRSSMLELGTCSTWRTRTSSLETWKRS
jgi:pimeloyl-ACP methyl ester carboxylesterase